MTAPEIDSFDHVQLAAPPGSEDALRAYYAGTLGMAEIPKPPVLAARGGCWFAAGSVELHQGTEADFRPARKAHPGIRVRGIEALAARLIAAGAPVTWDENLPGHRRFYTWDPAGNRLEFLEPDPGNAVSGEPPHRRGGGFSYGTPDASPESPACSSTGASTWAARSARRGNSPGPGPVPASSSWRTSAIPAVTR